MLKRITNPQSLNIDLAALLLRLIFGGMFIYHGWLHFEGYSQYSSMMPDYIGIGGKNLYILVTTCELIGGIFLVLGFLTRFAVTPIFIIVMVAYLVAHKKDPFLAKMLLFVYIFLCPVIFLLGSGRYSLDSVLFKNKTA